MMPINAYPAKSMEDRPMKVNLGKLTEGIGTVFTGVLQMLESIDVKSAEKLLSSIRQEENEVPFVEDASGDAGDMGDTGAIGLTGDTGGTGKNGASVENSTSASGNGSQSGKTENAENKEIAEKTAKAAKTGDKDSTGISLDDLTKIIVRKLKQDRANNGKIEAILKSYGVEKVCELPQEKYESFITEIATL